MRSRINRLRTRISDLEFKLVIRVINGLSVSESYFVAAGLILENFNNFPKGLRYYIDDMIIVEAQKNAYRFEVMNAYDEFRFSYPYQWGKERIINALASEKSFQRAIDYFVTKPDFAA